MDYIKADISKTYIQILKSCIWQKRCSVLL